MIALYHSDPELKNFTAEVISCVPVDGAYEVILSNTAFYPTGGGQPCDLGTLNGYPVTDVIQDKETEPIRHIVESPEPLYGIVNGGIDWNRRLDHMQQHSGQHLLSHFLYERFGAYSLGLHIGEKDSYLDLKEDGSWQMTRQIADEIEAAANRWIAENEPVKCFFPTAEEMKALPLRKKPDAHEMLRIVCIGRDEAVACCGTHVSTTGQVQMVHILSWQNSHGNLRIFFVAGQRAIEYAALRGRQADAAARFLSCNVSDLFPAVERLKSAQTELMRALGEIRKRQIAEQLSALQPDVMSKGNLYAVWLEEAEDQQLRDGLNVLISRDEKAVVLLCAPGGEQVSVAMGTGKATQADAGKLIRTVLNVFGGKGGGRKESAFGRSAQMDIERAREILAEQLV